MRTLTTLLAGFEDHKAARFRGLVLGQLLRAARRNPEPGLLHLFLLPPGPGQTRFALYETAQPLNLEVPVAEAIRQVLETLHRFAGDPRGVPGGDQGWRNIDIGRHGFYLGTGARFGGMGPGRTGTTIVRLVDRTALYIGVDARHRPVDLHASQPMIFKDEPVPAMDDIPAVREPPFVLIDTVVGFLR
jgi:hypothetical protein